jgi:hypothetical protein
MSDPVIFIRAILGYIEFAEKSKEMCEQKVIHTLK